MLTKTLKTITHEQFMELIRPEVPGGRPKLTFICPIGKCTMEFNRPAEWLVHMIEEHPERIRSVDQVEFALTEEELSIYD